MDRFFSHLTHLVVERRRLVIGVWAIAVLLAVPLSLQQRNNLTNGGFIVNGSQSATVQEAFARFPNAPRDDLAVVLKTERPDPSGIRSAVRRIGADVGEVGGVRLTSFSRRRAVLTARVSNTVILTIDVAGDEDDVNDAAVRLEPAINDSSSGGVQQYFVGQSAYWAALSAQTHKDLKEAEMFGLPLAFLIMVCVFGSLLAAFLPVALGLVAVALSGAAIYFLAQFGDMSVYVTNTAAMIGTGVAIDYSLFILVRYRQQRSAGDDERTAISGAIRTSGFAVLVSGLTVVISLLSLLIVDSTLMRSLAFGAIVVVAIGLVGALTLTPVLIQLLGLSKRAFRRAPAGSAADDAVGGFRAARFWRRWTALVMRRPVLMVCLSAGLLLLLAAPVLSLKVGERALVQLPADSKVRTGLDLVEPLVGVGATGPIRVLASYRSGEAKTPDNAAATRRLLAQLRDEPRLVEVSRPLVSTDRQAVLITAVPRMQPDSPAASQLVGDLRLLLARSWLAGRADTAVGGTSAHARDFEMLITGSLWKVLGGVVLMTFLLLTILLRSLLLPLKAVVVTGLTVAASYGILVVLFQWGVAGMGIGYVSVVNLPAIIAVTFGLTMDYQVFLLLRIREAYVRSGDNETAVAEGLASSAGVITSAAAIMVVIFFAFAFTGVPAIKQLSIGFGCAIVLDATLVRLVLVPAAMKLLGDLNWWLPKGLAARLPELPSEFSLPAHTARSLAAPGGRGLRSRY
jgi:RND superfamily putative drug exporter